MRRAALLVTVTLSLPLLRVPAQELGQRIRLRTDSAPSRWAVGTLMAQDADSFRLLLAGQAAPVSVARSAVTRLEISRGRKRAVLEGVSAGFGLGFMAGVNVAGRAEGSRGCPNGFSGLCALDMEAYVFQSGVKGGVIGRLVGAAIGFAVRTERWEGVEGGRAQVAFDSRGARLAVSIVF